jgi:hypothetical protein
MLAVRPISSLLAVRPISSLLIVVIPRSRAPPPLILVALHSAQLIAPALQKRRQPPATVLAVRDLAKHVVVVADRLGVLEQTKGLCHMAQVQLLNCEYALRVHGVSGIRSNLQ